MKIYKYKFDNTGVSIPVGGRILSCQMQERCLHIWALVDPDEQRTDHYDVQVIGTGHDFNPNGWDYLTTVQDNSFVWHIWTKKNDWEFS